MIIRICLEKPRRGLTLITPDKRSAVWGPKYNTKKSVSERRDIILVHFVYIHFERFEHNLRNFSPQATPKKT